MIRRLQYKEIDLEKYEHCLENSAQKNFYAQKNILNQLCESWELLVHGDYEAVMPIPLKKNLGLNFVAGPIFCQQLGIFSSEDSAALNEKFKIFLEENYRVLYYPFNFRNEFVSSITKRKNYEIPIENYDVLKKRYSKGRKAILARSNEIVDLKKLDLDETLEKYIIAHFKGLDKRSDVVAFLNLIKFLNKRNELSLSACFQDNKIASLAIIENTKTSMILLALINDPALQKYNGATFLINEILKKNISEKSLDLMGGNKRGIEIFFKSFGAELQGYAIIENSKKEIIKNFLKF